MAPRRGNHSILCSGLLAAGLVFTASSADAQSAGNQSPSGQAGLRMLSWPGKAEAPRAQQRPAADARTSDVGPPAPLQIQPSVLPDYTASARTFPQSLTPANAFGSTPVSAGGQAYASAPVPYSQVAPRTVEAAPTPVAPPPQTPVAQTPVAQTPVAQTPVRSPRTEAPDQQHDPMAPRADAPVWRTASAGAAQPAPQPSSQPSTQPAPQPRASTNSRDGARYYSVHREAGRTPDATTLPAPFFLDSAPVDLAEPPPPPALMRNQGGLAPSVAGDDL